MNVTYREVVERHNVLIASLSGVERIGRTPHAKFEASDGSGRKLPITKDKKVIV